MSVGSVSVTVTDDDSVGVTISKTSLDIEEGDSATYTVALDSEPTGSVTVTLERTGQYGRDGGPGVAHDLHRPELGRRTRRSP